MKNASYIPGYPVVVTDDGKYLERIGDTVYTRSFDDPYRHDWREDFRGQRNFKVRIDGDNHTLQVLRKKNDRDYIVMLDKNPNNQMALRSSDILHLSASYYKSSDRKVENKLKEESSRGNFFVRIKSDDGKSYDNRSYKIDGTLARKITDYEFTALPYDTNSIAFKEEDFRKKYNTGKSESQEYAMQHGIKFIEGFDKLEQTFRKELSMSMSQYHHEQSNTELLDDIPVKLGKIEAVEGMRKELAQYQSGKLDASKLSFSYDKYNIPEEAGIKSVNLRKDNKGRWLLSVSTEKGTTMPTELKKGDVYAFEHLKICTKEQLAAKYYEKVYNYAIENKRDKSRSLKVW